MTKQVMSKKVQLAYVAGIIDGEGCFGIEYGRKNNTYSPTVQVVMTALKPLERLRGLFGGSICKHRHDPRYKQAYHFTAKGGNAMSIVELISNSLIEKRSQAMILSRLGESISEWNSKNRKRGNLPAEVTALRADLKKQISELKIVPTSERPIRTMSKVERLSYLAGVLEAEGCFSIIRGDKNCFFSVVTVQMTCRPVLEEIQEVFGGTIIDRNKSDSRKPIFMWRVKGGAAADLCRAIKPYLGFRNEEADLLILLQNTTNLWAKKVGRNGMPAEITEKRIRWMNRLHDIHSPNRARAETKPESAERRSDSPVCIEPSDAGLTTAAYAQS